MAVLADQTAPSPEGPAGPQASPGAGRRPEVPGPRRAGRIAAFFRRRAVVLEAFTWLYLAWSILPIAIAVLFSFNKGKSQSTWQGFSWRWYFGDPINSVLHNPELHQAVVQTLLLAGLTTAITVPLGVAFAIGIDRWRGRVSSSLNFVMVFSFVVPELLLAIALFFVVTQLLHFIPLGTNAEIAGLVVWNLSWPAIIVRARLVTIGKVYEEAAADLGASRLQALWRVLMRMLMPAVFASAVLVFAGVIDDFVIVEQLSSTANTQPVSVLIYSNVHGGLAGPSLNALATLMLLFSLVVAVLGYVAYRLLTRGERQSSAETLTTIAGI
ncbi:MAG TPA: ABC transporter permease [Acidimicrobiales bacterium]|nr:ABC transporter permease [Acidimicrobiales bacterium]